MSALEASLRCTREQRMLRTWLESKWLPEVIIRRKLQLASKWKSLVKSMPTTTRWLNRYPRLIWIRTMIQIYWRNQQSMERIRRKDLQTNSCPRLRKKEHSPRMATSLISTRRKTMLRTILVRKLACKLWIRTPLWVQTTPTLSQIQSQATHQTSSTRSLARNSLSQRSISRLPSNLFSTEEAQTIQISPTIPSWSKILKLPTNSSSWTAGTSFKTYPKLRATLSQCMVGPLLRCSKHLHQWWCNNLLGPYISMN